MKQIVLCIFLMFLFISLTSKAQNTSEYGIKAGYTISSFNTKDDMFDGSYRSGVVLGGYGKIPLGDKISFQPEFLIAQKGYKEKVSGLEIVDYFFKLKDTPVVYVVNRETTNRLTYLSLPLLISYSVTKQFGFLLGGEPSVLVHENRTDKYTGMKNFTEHYSDIEHQSFDMGFVFGVQVNRNKIHLDVRYVYGLMDARDLSDYAYTNSSFQIALGYRMFKKRSYY